MQRSHGGGEALPVVHHRNRRICRGCGRDCRGAGVAHFRFPLVEMDAAHRGRGGGFARSGRFGGRGTGTVAGVLVLEQYCYDRNSEPKLDA